MRFMTSVRELAGDQPRLIGGGEAGDLIRSKDWGATPLGSIAAWPVELVANCQTVLSSAVPMVVLWGTQGILLYNDGYAAICGPRHPAAMGGKLLEVWPEAREFNARVIEAGLRGEALSFHRQELELWRNGQPERVWMDLEYLPIRDSEGCPIGSLAMVFDITERVLAERRLAQSEELYRFLDRLGQTVAGLQDADDVLSVTMKMVAAHLKASNCAYADMDADEDGFTIRGDWHAPGSPSIVGHYSLADFGRLAVQQLTAGRPLIINDNLTEIAPSEAKTFQDIGIAATVCMPLVKNGQLTALMAIHDKMPRRWSDYDLTVIREVTDRSWAHVERVGAEANLRAREEQLRLAIEAAEIGLWDVDEVAGTLFWPPRVKAMFGISPDVPVSLADFYAGLHPDDFEATAAAFAAAADPERRAVYEVEYRTIGKEDGVERWVAAKGRGVFEDGRCLRLIGTAIDITHRKHVEAQLRDLNETLEQRVAAALAERKLLADVVDGTDIFVQVVDRNYNWLAINTAAAAEFARIFGVRQPQAGDNMLAVLQGHAEHQAAVREVWSRALGGEEFIETDAFGDLSIDRRSYEMRFRSLRDSDGHVIGAYQFVSDVTERLREQQRLQRAEAALAQAQKMEAVGQLTGGIAHDFNNLLQGVTGCLDLIRRKSGDPDRVQRWADAGLKAAERGSRLTGQLLAFSRAQKIELKPVPLSDLITNFREMIDRTIGAHITVRLDLGADGVRVLGDDVQIEMAVLNLALNARDAMPEGGELTISTRSIRMERDRELDDGDYIELAVRDTGTGMPPEIVTRAFDPFFTTKGIGKGTGLGLSQVYGAMRQGGGTVRIESAPGKGTTVRLFFRQTDNSEKVESSTTRSVITAGVSAQVLVIDDDADVRHFVAECLETLGFAVTLAEDGAAGLAELQRSEPDVIILDFAMPGLNGAEVAKRVKDIRPALPIIFATGYAESTALAQVFDGPAPLLKKPFQIDELERVLIATLQHRAQANLAQSRSRPS
ncbi:MULTISPECIES: PAS domain S-box protein [unclassified Novosphingobium]|uniref:PAS domain S-box protein n=1 Tax=unclassified Novosphingobium TaxID=2644732 RepID=UPI00146BB558|nr:MULTISPECIES: PAS domain S-box protein [unclassified Novosphingobium]NMN05016.1 PAS domain S-box-containing protein [Novosphingobium sp. SG919]NMN87310.1 PAS domain S-box-containing protein [Novosphingobium sp. SG916]